MNDLDDVAREFVGLFERTSVPYAVMGGIALRLYAIPRPTFDVDFTAAIDRRALPELYRAAGELGFAIPEAQHKGWIDSIRDLAVVKFQWFVGSRVIDVDVFLAETSFQAQVLKRRRRLAMDGWEGWFVTAEDLILLKLLANRPKDRVDVADVLFVQGRLDETYLRSWAEILGVEAELNEALRSQSD